MSETFQPKADLEFAKAAAELAADTRCTDVVLLDVAGRSQVTHYFLIATGTSPRQMTTVAEQIAELGGKMGFKPWRISGAETAKWLLIDCVDVVVHLFDASNRAFYDLEMLWGDCPRIDLNLPQTATPQSLQTEAALEAIQEVIDAVVDLDDELLLIEANQDPASEDTPSLFSQPPMQEADEGIAAPPDDQAISYESISIEVNADDDASGGPVIKPAKKSKPVRRKVASKKPASRKPAKPAAKARPAVKAKVAKKAISGVGKRSTARAGKPKAKPVAKSKPAAKRGKPPSKAAAGSKSTAGVKWSAAKILKAKAVKIKASKPKAPAKKVSKGKATSASSGKPGRTDGSMKGRTSGAGKPAKSAKKRK